MSDTRCSGESDCSPKGSTSSKRIPEAILEEELMGRIECGRDRRREGRFLGGPRITIMKTREKSPVNFFNQSRTDPGPIFNHDTDHDENFWFWRKSPMQW